jgi:solute:Na+ symporter, SSS family
MTAFQLAPADVLVMAVYLAGILALGLWASRRQATTEDYFLAGRSLTWPLIGASLFASNISSSSFIGLTGDAYRSGISVYNYEWVAVPVLVLFVVVFLPLYLRARVYTLPEYLGRRFDGHVRLYVSGVGIVSSVLLEAAGALYGAGLVVQLLYPDVPMWAAALGLGAITGAYTAVGGLRSVVYTDAVQAMVLLAGATAVAVAVTGKVTWAEVTAATPDASRHLVQPLSDETLPWLGLVTGLPLLGIYYWCSNQYVVQRTLGAKTLVEGRLGALFAGSLKLPLLFLVVLPGLYARVLYPDLARPDLAFPTLLFDLLPVGVRGAVLVALLAALMSSLDSTVNAAATLVTMDFARRLRPGLSGRALVQIGRVTTVVVVGLGIAWAPQIGRFPSLWQYLQTILAYLTPPIAACFLFGALWPRATAAGARVALGVGLVLAAGLAVGPVDLHFLYVAALVFAGSALALILVSVTTAPPPHAVRLLVWSPATWRAEDAAQGLAPWYRDYRVYTAALLAAASLVVWAFR